MSTYDHLRDLLGAIKEAAVGGDIDSIIAACETEQARLESEEVRVTRTPVMLPVPPPAMSVPVPQERLSPAGMGTSWSFEPEVGALDDALRFLLRRRDRLREGKESGTTS